MIPLFGYFLEGNDLYAGVDKPQTWISRNIKVKELEPEPNEHSLNWQIMLDFLDFRNGRHIVKCSLQELLEDKGVFAKLVDYGFIYDPAYKGDVIRKLIFEIRDIHMT